MVYDVHEVKTTEFLAGYFLSEFIVTFFRRNP